MKIEKLNDNQIRCTLTGEDLAKRNLRISELAYGSEKTQNLFREMVKQADYQYGFETENIPLVVEAIPTSSGSIVLIITKIEISCNFKKIFKILQAVCSQSLSP